MKKLLLGLSGLLICGGSLFAQQALFVKKGSSYTKYNFGVAGDLKFSDNGHKLQISGYNEIIDLDNIDFISFNAPSSEGMLTPYAQKQKMIEIGEAVNALVNQKSVGDLIRMSDAFLSHHEANGKTFHPAVEYEVPEEYWNVHKDFSDAMKALSSLAGGNPAGIRAMRAKAVDLYKAADYFGVYVADQEKEEWVKTTDADYLEIQFKGYDGTNYSVRLDCGKEISKWESSDFIGEMPVTMSVAFSVNSIRVASMEIKTRLVQDESIDMDVEFNASGYRVTNALAIIDRLITDQVKVFVNGKESISAVSRINGANLVKYDIMREDIKESLHYHDENDECCGEDPEALIAHFFRAQSDVDVLGRLQVKGHAFDFSRLYNSAKDLDDEVYSRWNLGSPVESVNSDGSVITVYNDELEERQQQEDILSYLNNYSDIQFFYDGGSELQGFLTFDLQDDGWERVYDRNDYSDMAYVIKDGRLRYVEKRDGQWLLEWYDPTSIVDPADVIYPSKVRYLDYEISPRLTFADMTSYAFEDFFDESSFKELINDYESIIDTYESITGQK